MQAYLQREHSLDERDRAVSKIAWIASFTGALGFALVVLSYWLAR